VSASSDRTLRVWDSVTGKQIGNAITGHDDSVNCIAFAHSVNNFATVSDDETVRFWQLAEIGKKS
jgi:WD40 repeat protein